jgi:nitric oxide reductase NorE protein
VSRPNSQAGEQLPGFLWLDDEDAEPDSLPRPSPQPSERSQRHTPGEVGLWIFILGDMTLFGAILLVFLWERRSNTSGFKESAAQLIQPIGAVNTLVLLLSSYLVVRAVSAHRAARPQDADRLIRGAICCAAVFAVLKAAEYVVEVSEGNTPSTGLFFTFYFILTGLHLLHVLVGTGLLSVWRVSVGNGRQWSSAGRFVEGVAVYWHMVDLLWIAIFTLVYLVCAE